MTTRNYDSSQLTMLRADRNIAYFFTRQLVTNGTTSAQGVSLPTFNGQTGVWDASKIAKLDSGVQADINRTTGGATTNNISSSSVLQQEYAYDPPSNPIPVIIPPTGPLQGQINFVS